ncbi:MAG: hypothetical protein DI588_05655 [Flavobacterium johnsoniae]|nr:MAG: hypothetical protein DI588_05655 [Flavobacterium johnsoniae]
MQLKSMMLLVCLLTSFLKNTNSVRSFTLTCKYRKGI